MTPKCVFVRRLMAGTDTQGQRRTESWNFLTAWQPA